MFLYGNPYTKFNGSFLQCFSGKVGVCDTGCTRSERQNQRFIQINSLSWQYGFFFTKCKNYFK